MGGSQRRCRAGMEYTVGYIPGRRSRTGHIHPLDTGLTGLEVRVERVIDGDTIVCEGLGSVRLLCIDTPERGEPGFEEAKARMEELVGGRVILLRFDVELRDWPGRLLAWPEVDGVAVGPVMVREGLAGVMAVKPNTTFCEECEEAVP